MKGGKQGRQRRATGTVAKGKAASHGAAKHASANRPGSEAPKKGERVKTFGGRSSRETEDRNGACEVATRSTVPNRNPRPS